MDLIEEKRECEQFISEFKSKSLIDRMNAPAEEQKRFYESSKRLKAIDSQLR